MQMKKHLFLFLLLCLFPFYLQAQEVSLPTQNTVNIDLETGEEIAQWVEEARKINPFYRTCNCAHESKDFLVPVTTQNPLFSNRWIFSLSLATAKQGKSEAADVSFHDVGVSGFGLSLMYQFSPFLELGMAYEWQESEDMHHYTPSYQVYNEDETYHVMLAGRFRPKASSFYIPFGLGYAHTEQDITETISYGGYVYTSTYYNTRGLNGWTLYLGLGWDFALTQNLSFSVEGRYQYLDLEEFSASSLKAAGALNIRF